MVYDSVDPSPFYDNVPGDMYIDEKDLIELPLVAPTEDIREPYQKKNTLNSRNLPYNLEQPI